MMRNRGRTIVGLLFSLAFTAMTPPSFAQTLPASTTAPATEPAATTTPARKPTVEELLPKTEAPFEFSDLPIGDVMAYIEKSYGLTIMNQYTLKDRVTMKLPGTLKAQQAISILNETILPLGYTVLESVRGDPPHVVLTIVATKRDPGTMVPVFRGIDAAKIPKNDELRTQVIPLANLDPAKARETVAPVLGERADITVNVESKTLIITDTGEHIHTAAALLQILEQQAGDSKK